MGGEFNAFPLKGGLANHEASVFWSKNCFSALFSVFLKRKKFLEREWGSNV